MSHVSFMKNPLLVFGLFIVSVTGVWAVQPASTVSARCGVHTGRVASFAGVVIESNWRRYSDGAMLESRGTNIYIENADWRGDPDPQWGGNIVRLTAGNMVIAGAGVDSGVFNQYDSGCGDGHNAVFGYDATSARDLGGGNFTGWGPWALDCDAQLFGVGNERYFRITGSGVPSGARGGGSWNVVTFQPPNGFTSYVTLTYVEPAPPDSPPVGVFDAATCSAIWGWAFDPDNSSISIPVHVYIDGVGIALTANQSRPDVNAAYGIGGNHGFSYDISSRVSDGGTHTITIYAIGINSSGAGNGVNPSLGTRTVSGCRNYNLTPTVTAGNSTIVVGEPASFTYRINRVGTSSSPSTDIWIKEYVVAPAPAGTFNTGVGIQDNVATNCDPRYGATTCAKSWQLPPRAITGSGTDITTAGASPAYVPTSTASMTPGTRICQMLAINPAGQNSGGTIVNHRWSAPVCVVIGKKPYLSIRNGDGWAGGSFETSPGICPVNATDGFDGTTTTFTATDGHTYGSYSEYGLTSLRGVNEFGSAGKPLGTRLTFRNTPLPVGNYSTATTNHCLNNALAYYGPKSPGPNLNAVATFNVQNAYGAFEKQSAGSLTLTSTAPGPMIIGADPTRIQSIVLIVEGDILIDKNIEYANRIYSDISRLPSLVVISRNGSIKISQNVTRLDGFYQAKNNFMTCRESEAASKIGENDGLCQQPLTVNGAVTASKIIPRRIPGGSMVGGVDRRNDAAEMFIARPDMFLSQYAQSRTTGQLRAVDENELPPQY